MRRKPLSQAKNRSTTQRLPESSRWVWGRYLSFPLYEFPVIRRSPQGNAVTDAAAPQRESKGLAVVATVSGQTAGTGARSTSSSGNLDLSQGRRCSRNIGHVAFGQMTG